MKMLHIRIFICAALLCGAFCCADAMARVCFVVDEDCKTGFVNFPEIPEFDAEKQCKDAGFDKTQSECAELGNNPGAFCPFDSNYVKCCGPEYRYQACVFPQEYTGNANDKCGNLYKCKCSSEYKTSDEWKSGGTNCAPGGDVCISGADDTVRYSKCTCDNNYFPYSQSCSAQSLIHDSSCTNSDGKTSYRCQCPSSYRTCAYGGAVGAKSCQQGGITLYSSCKSPEDECKNAGYYDDCDKRRNCYYETQSTVVPDPQKYTKNNPILCENSTDACPYAWGYYKCRWSAANYCKALGMTEKSASSSTIPTSCTTEGIRGTVVPCRLDGDENGSGSGRYLGYYKCKLTCEQRMLSRVGVYLRPDERFGTKSDGSYLAYYLKVPTATRYFKAGTHLFLRDNFRIPDAGLPVDGKSGSDFDINIDALSSKGRYTSINGMGALYRLNPNIYAECKEDYEAGSKDNSKNPTITFPMSQSADFGSNKKFFFSRDFNNINVTLSYKDDKGRAQDWKGREYLVEKGSRAKTTYIWNNFGLKQNWFEGKLTGTGASIENSYGVLYWKGLRTVISQEENTKIKFTGKINFDLRGFTPSITMKDPLGKSASTESVDIASLAFHGQGYHIIEFNGADLSPTEYTEYAPDLDTDDGDGKGGVVVIENSKVYARAIMSQLNVDVNKNSTVNLNRLILAGRHDNYDISSGTWSRYGRRYCSGMSVRNNSTVNVEKSAIDVWDDRYLYVSGGGKVISAAPIRLRTAGRSVACIADTTSSITAYGTTYNSTDYAYAASFSEANGQLNSEAHKGWIMPPQNLTKRDNRRIMYSIGDNACMPYKLNASYKNKSDSLSKPKYDNAYSNICTGGWFNPVNFMANNPLSDVNTFSTPGTFNFSVAYRYERSNGVCSTKYDVEKLARVDSWLGLDTRNNAAYYTPQGRTCDPSTVSPATGVKMMAGLGNICAFDHWEGVDSAWKNGKMVGKDAAAGPRFNNTAIRYAYVRCSCGSGTANQCAGCSGEVKFICSGCSYCVGGVSYKSWSDQLGGFGTKEY